MYNAGYLCPINRIFKFGWCEFYVSIVIHERSCFHHNCSSSHDQMCPHWHDCAVILHETGTQATIISTHQTTITAKPGIYFTLSLQKQQVPQAMQGPRAHQRWATCFVVNILVISHHDGASQRRLGSRTWADRPCYGSSPPHRNRNASLGHSWVRILVC